MQPATISKNLLLYRICEFKIIFDEHTITRSVRDNTFLLQFQQRPPSSALLLSSDKLSLRRSARRASNIALPDERPNGESSAQDMLVQRRLPDTALLL